MSTFLFFPTELEDAVQKAKDRHQKHRTPNAGYTTQWLEAILKSLSHIKSDKYGKLFAPLRPNQLRILVQHLPSLYPDELFEQLLMGLKTRRQKSVAVGLWALLGRFCQIDGLVSALTQMQQSPSWVALSPGTLPDLPAPLQNERTIAYRLARPYMESREPWQIFVKTLRDLSPNTPEDQWDDLPLGKRILKFLLLEDLVIYHKEESENLLAWAKNLLNNPELATFAFGYLTNTPIDDWHPATLKYLVEKLDDPRLSPHYWTKIPPDILRAVISWINTEKLASFFIQGAKDSERFEFWKAFVDDMGPYSAGYIRQGQGLFEFPGFGVVEFMEVGNAAYIYPIDVYRAYFKRAPTYLNDTLKDRRKVLHWNRREMRIIHSGNWQRNWHYRINGLIQADRANRFNR